MADFVAVLDANVLYPAPVRDVLMEVAVDGIYQARWTERIHEEWIRNLVANRADLDPSVLRRTADLMNKAVPDCLIEGYEHLIHALSLPTKVASCRRRPASAQAAVLCGVCVSTLPRRQ